MKRRLLFILFFCVSSQVIANSPAILILGDSISAAYGIDTREGWVNLLQQRLKQKGHDYRVINASVSGDTTLTGLGRLEAALKQHRPEFVIVALGGNDGLRGFSFSEIKNNLTKIIDTNRRHHAKTLLAGIQLPPNYGPAYNDRFAQLYRQVAKQHKVPLVPYLMEHVANHRHLMQDDGIHPTAAAQTQILDNVWGRLEPLLKNH